MEIHHISISGELAFFNAVIKDERIAGQSVSDFAAWINHEFPRVLGNIGRSRIADVPSPGMSFDLSGFINHGSRAVRSQVSFNEIVEVGRNAPNGEVFPSRSAFLDGVTHGLAFLKGP